MRRFACFAILLGVAICCLANGVAAETEMDSEAMRDAMTARALDELGYKVLMPGAHETADCRALQKAFDAASSVLDANTRNGSKCFTMMHEFKKIDCVILSRVGAVGGNVMGELEEAKQALLKAKVAIQNGFNAAVDKTKEVAKAAGNAIANGANKAVQAGKNALDWLKKKVSFKNAPLPDAGDLYAAIVTGAREPDLPCGDRDAAIAACLKAVAKGGIFSGVAGAILNKANIAQAQVDATTKAIEVQQFSPQARASHFGYMSIGHSQTANRPGDNSVPGVVQVLEDSKVWDKQRYKFPRRTKQVKSATQQDVADLIADWELHLLEQGLAAVGHKKYDFFVYHLARFGHTIMDSFSCAHAVRLADAAAGYPVMYFMDYGSQDGGQHSKNGDELPGDPPFNAHVAGFKYGIDLVAKGMQIFLHAAVAKETGKPYVKVYPSYTGPANPKNEMTWFLNTKVYHFAAPGFAKHSAAGCVTKDTVAPGKEKDICKIGTTKGYMAQAASKASSVCPDRPLPFEQVFVPGGESAVSSSSSSHGSSSVSKATKPGPGGAKTPSKNTKKN